MAKMKYRWHLSYYLCGQSTPGHFLPVSGGLAPLARRKVSLRILPFGYRPRNIVPKWQLQINCIRQNCNAGCTYATMCTDMVPRGTFCPF